ncbi:ABC transporter ATP-binding protein [Fontibacillus sp. BL9]|uniref:ABC transporter ATP-binding protein n=1 Tax=Fontibacillus sp. BL9 TaxID=3389971 RepID=UPI00397E6BBF
MIELNESTVRKEFVRSMSFMKRRMLIYLTGMIGMSFMLSVIPVIQAMIMKKMIEAAERSNFNLLLEGIQILLVSLALICVFIPLFRYMYNACAKLATEELKITVFDQRSKLPIRYFEKNHSGQILSTLTNGVTTMAGLYTGRLRRLIHPIIYGLTAAVPMFVMEWRISSILLALNLLSVYLNTLFTKKMRRISRIIQQSLGNLSSSLVDMLSGALVMKMFPIHRLILNRYQNNNDATTQFMVEREKVSGKLDGLNYFMGFASNIIILTLGSFMVYAGGTSFGTLFALMFLQTRLSQAFLEIGIFIPEVQQALSGSEQIFQLLDEPREPEQYEISEHNDQTTDTSNSYISFNNVSFGYDLNHPVLNEFGVSIGKGQSVALVGPSGCGKSTVLKLLLGFYPVDQGTIIIDNKPLNQYHLKELRNKIAYIPQESYLFSGTIEDNILYGKPEAGEEEIVEAAKAAFAHEFIMGFPEGYKTMVGERGNKLSGGQKQRISIARAILKNSPILLLDEATSSLDSESEHLVQLALMGLMKDRTTITIAHRFSTIEQSDLICVVSQGSVIEKGSHCELIRTSSMYKQLYEQHHQPVII